MLSKSQRRYDGAVGVDQCPKDEFSAVTLALRPRYASPPGGPSGPGSFSTLPVFAAGEQGP